MVDVLVAWLGGLVRLVGWPFDLLVDWRGCSVAWLIIWLFGCLRIWLLSRATRETSMGKIIGLSSVAGDEERKIDDRVELRERRGAMGLGTILLHGILIARPHNTSGP